MITLSRRVVFTPVRVHLSTIGPYPLAQTMGELARHSKKHDLTDDPEDADLILLCGNFALRPGDLLDHPLYRAYRQKCAVYTADDAYCPLAAGVYASPRRGPSTILGRVRSYSYASTFSVHSNTEVQEASRSEPAPPPPEGSLLFSFVGSSNSALRRRILREFASRPEAVVRDSSHHYQHFDADAPGRREGQRTYAETLMASRFCLCPRGRGTGSFRLFEVMSLGRVPVLLSDSYVLPRGPRWQDFLVKVPERRYRRLPETLRRLSPSSEERQRSAREEWERWFSREVLFDRVVDAADEARRAGARVRRLYRLLVPMLVGMFRLRLASTKAAAAMIARVHPTGSRASTVRPPRDRATVANPEGTGPEKTNPEKLPR
jgi:hypothetical protein